jgi:hypothetical protein
MTKIAASRHFRLALLSLICAVASCSPLSNPDDDSPDFRQKTTSHFLFLYTSSDDATIDALADDMEAMLARLKAKFQVDTTSQITVVLFPNRATFNDANNSEFWVTAVTRGRSRIEMVSPDAPNQVFDLWPDTRAEHMLTHIVSLRVNASSGNNPRWLWESIALYESGQKASIGNVDFFAPDGEPSLSQLNGGYGTPIFDVGWYLGEYLETTYGTQVFIDLLEAEGNVAETLGISGDQLIADFVAFVRQKYEL